MDLRNSLASLLVMLGCSLVGFGQPVPCSLLTPDQLKAVLGEPVSAASPIANTGCSWKGTGASKATVTVSMQSEKMFAAAKSAANMSKVSGVGDEAYFTGVPNFSSLWVKKGSTVLLVRIYSLPVNEAQPKLTALGKTAVSKL